jgi:hypothetical protein
MPVTQLDLNALRETILQNQADGDPLPEEPSRRVRVDRAGRILLTDEDNRADERTLSVVHQGVFAAS